MKGIKRRDFLKYSGLGIAAIYVGGCGGGGGGGGGGGFIPGTATLDITITDAVKEMVTHQVHADTPLDRLNPAECYFWVYQIHDVTDPDNPMHFPSECPGPNIFCRAGDRITINVTNTLDLAHSFFIPGMVNTGPIPPGETVELTFTAGAPGTYLYHDNLNAPVNRVMGLHGAFVVMPTRTPLDAPTPGTEPTPALTPYANPTPSVQQLFNDFGRTDWFPGLRWAERDFDDAAHEFPAQPTRQYVWLCHQASPVLFDEVGLAARAGQTFDPAEFVTAFTADPFVATSNDPDVPTVDGDVFNRKPHFFTIAGQSGHYAHHNPSLAPTNRIGEPSLIRILNAGLWTHSLHLHANHFYVTAVNNVPSANPIWVDVFNIHPMDHVDYVIPYMRPPDIPNARGIGRADAALTAAGGGSTYPPVEEFQMFLPLTGNFAQSYMDPTVLIDLHESQSPLCYPMHDHSEPTQVSQGGNYNCGLIAGLEFIGDRNTPGLMNFEMEEDFKEMLEQGGSTSATGEAAGPEHIHPMPATEA